MELELFKALEIMRVSQSSEEDILETYETKLQVNANDDFKVYKLCARSIETYKKLSKEVKAQLMKWLEQVNLNNDIFIEFLFQVALNDSLMGYEKTLWDKLMKDIQSSYKETLYRNYFLLVILAIGSENREEGLKAVLHFFIEQIELLITDNKCSYNHPLILNEKLIRSGAKMVIQCCGRVKISCLYTHQITLMYVLLYYVNKLLKRVPLIDSLKLLNVVKKLSKHDQYILLLLKILRKIKRDDECIIELKHPKGYTIYELIKLLGDVRTPEQYIEFLIESIDNWELNELDRAVFNDKAIQRIVKVLNKLK